MHKGFTLVQLSIVLVIIGVLMGGILAARSMVETAKIQRLISDLQQYEAATATFQKTYKFLPGDSSNFTPPGNADNILLWGAGTSPVICANAPNATLSNQENMQFFAHLSQAEMLDKTYIPYAPTACGGTHVDITSVAGIVTPYSEPGEKYVQLGGNSKVSIVPSKNNPTLPLYLPFWVKPLDAILLENKLGSIITNPWGAGQCPNTLSGGSTVICSNPNAVYGLLYWNFQNL